MPFTSKVFVYDLNISFDEIIEGVIDLKNRQQ